MHKLPYIKEYIDAGFALVPIPAGSKRPMHCAWNQKANVITTLESAVNVISNVGLCHAYCTPNPTAALDIDDYDLTIRWLNTYDINLEALIRAPDAVLIESGRVNRSKLIYELPDDVVALPSVQVLDQDTKAVVFELRCATKAGRTVQDVLPPSIHPQTGKPYRWAGNGHYSQLPKFPHSLLTMWTSLLQDRKSNPDNSHRATCGEIFGASNTTPIPTEPETPRRIARVREQLSYIDPDCSYPFYRDIVWAVTDTGWTCTWDLLKEWSEDAPHRFNGETLRALIDSYRKDGGIHLGTLVHHAQQAGWRG